MKPNNIIYADLSTYTPKETMHFYENVFDWRYYDTNNYYVAYKDVKEIVGLYETPEKYKKMGMPHFWMTYFEVNDLEQTIKKAKALGGIIELIDLTNAIGKIALIRDPQGAGFTIYEGSELSRYTKNSESNSLIWSELHVSNVANIIPFYKGIFNWEFKKMDNKSYKICNHESKHIADVMEISNDLKGKYEYWICTFGVENLNETAKKIVKNGGRVIYNEGTRILFTDNSNQAFFYSKETKK